MTLKLYPFQSECLNEIDWFDGRALLALDPGLGKTVISVEALHRHRDWLPSVVVCPASIKFQWAKESRRRFKRVVVLEGRRSHTIPSDESIVILNYDILHHWVSELAEIQPQTLICDECQALANFSQRTIATRTLSQGIPHVLALSGTPLVNRPSELWFTINMLAPDKFDSRLKFDVDFCDRRWTPWGWKATGAKSPRKLHRLLLKTCMVRRRKVEVLTELPEKIREVVPLPIERRREYERATRDFLSWLEEFDAERAERAARALAFTRTGYLLRLVAELKHRYMVEWIANWLQESDEKLVVFAKHTASITRLHRHFAKSLVIDGSVKGQRRLELVKQFATDNRARVLIGQLRAAGIGLDGLQHAAGNVCFAELGWTPGEMVQCEDRCYRIGTRTDRRVTCYYLVAANTIEERLCSILQSKQRVLDAVLDGKAGTVGLNVFDQLMKEVRRGKW